MARTLLLGEGRALGAMQSEYHAMPHSTPQPPHASVRSQQALGLMAAFTLGIVTSSAVFAALSMRTQQGQPAAVVEVLPRESQSQRHRALGNEVKVGAIVASLPHKLAVDLITPRALQLGRGTCWIFAAVAVLEHSYRRTGVVRGWLRPDQYLRMSEQAFGVAVLDVCSKANMTCGQLVGDQIWTGSQLMPIDTEGGEPYLLYYLRALRDIGALPWSVCPYTAQSGHDLKCNGLEKVLKSNPLRFFVRSMNTYYERVDVKTALVRSGRILTLGTQMVSIVYALPCTEETADAYQCNASDSSQCIACPLEPAFSGVACCIASERESNAIDGSFYRLPRGTHPEPKLEGGHAMAIVGYSDVYRTQHGFVGGYILKNSWWDGLPPEAFGGGWKHARGSHTVAFYMQQVSDEDERRICPNCHSPRTWRQCGSLAECRSSETLEAASKAGSPLNLECIDRSPFLHGLCNKGERFFLESITEHSMGVSVACFLRNRGSTPHEQKQVKAVVASQALAAVDPMSAEADQLEAEEPEEETRVCSPPVPLDDLAMVFTPVHGECQPNDPQLCGFYFFPYEMLEEINALYRGFEVSDMDVEWEPEAFAANQDQDTRSEGLNYSLIVHNTHVQRAMRFTGPTPLLHDPRPPSKSWFEGTLREGS